MLLRLVTVANVPVGREAFDLSIGETPEGVDPPSSRLQADRCDLLPKSGCVDPSPSLRPSERDIISSSNLLFPDPPDGMSSFGNVHREDVAQYARLVGRQLRSGKVVLSDYAAAGGTVFAVGKPSGAQREVWHGTRVSEAAVLPPKPPRLVSPTALFALRIPSGGRVLVSKRDARCYFDQLRLHSSIRHWFGRLKLKLDDLARHGGFSVDELECFYVEQTPLRSLSQVIPLCDTFPMGFSWSSFIAQSYLLSRCVAAGLQKDLFLADDSVAPTDLSQVYGLATDDLIVFTQDKVQHATTTVGAFD